eukprot:2556343-Ditylum_brightwellii.AAC.1
MLENTTQYFPTNVESKTRAYPVQRCQKQLFLLHLLRLKGRTCAAMLFSFVKSMCREVGAPNELLTNNSKV